MSNVLDAILRGGGGHTIKNQGEPLPARATIDIRGDGLVATDDESADATVLSVATPPSSIEAVTFEALQYMRNVDASVRAAFMIEQVGTSCGVESVIQPSGMYQWKDDWTREQALPNIIQPGYGTADPLPMGRWYKASPEPRALNVHRVSWSCTIDPSDDVVVIDAIESDAEITLNATMCKEVIIFRLNVESIRSCTVVASPEVVVNGQSSYTRPIGVGFGLRVVSLNDAGTEWLAFNLTM